MDVTAEDFRHHYQLLSDDALLEVDTGELVEVARTCHAEEVARRGLLEQDSPEDAATDRPESTGGATAEEEIVCIVEYDFLDEADLARGLLEAAEIPASLESEPGVVRLMVPARLADQALGMLATPLSDEELEAQAEAAGFEEEFEEDSDE